VIASSHRHIWFSASHGFRCRGGFDITWFLYVWFVRPFVKTMQSPHGIYITRLSCDCIVSSWRGGGMAHGFRCVGFSMCFPETMQMQKSVTMKHHPGICIVSTKTNASSCKDDAITRQNIYKHKTSVIASSHRRIWFSASHGFRCRGVIVVWGLSVVPVSRMHSQFLIFNS
jgi:hypothetical protein